MGVRNADSGRVMALVVVRIGRIINRNIVFLLVNLYLLPAFYKTFSYSKYVKISFFAASTRIKSSRFCLETHRTGCYNRRLRSLLAALMTFHQVPTPLGMCLLFYHCGKIPNKCNSLHITHLCWHLTHQVCQNARLWSTIISHSSKKAEITLYKTTAPT